MKKKYDPIIISICLTIVSLPLYLVKFSFFSLPLNLLLLISLFSLLVIISHTSLKNAFLFLKNNRLIIFFTLLIIFGCLLSIWHNGFSPRSFSIFIQWILLPAIFGFFAAINLQNKESQLDTILLSLFVSTTFVSAIALSYAILGIFTYDSRLKAFYESPNHLAMYIMPGVFLGTYFFIKAKKEDLLDKSLLYSILTVFIIITLTLTKSAGAMIAVLFSLPLAFFFIRSGLFRYTARLILLFGFTFLLSLSLFSATQITYLSHVPERSSLASRFMIWQSATKILLDNPLYGIGPGNFQAKYLAYQKYFPPYLEWAVPEPHNLYLAFWLQTGLLGFIGFILLVLLVLKSLAFKTKQKNALLAWTLLGIFVALLMHGLIDTPYWKNDLAFVFWILCEIAFLI